MKRCPECEFLYEDEQDRCDMDGAELRFTSFLPPLPLPQRVVHSRAKSIWGGFTIPLLVLVIVGSVLVILYRAAPPTFSSSEGLGRKPVTNADGAAEQPPSAPSPQLVTSPAASSSPAEPSRGMQNSNSDRSLKSTKQKPVTGGLEIHFQVGPAPVDNSSKPVNTKASPAKPAPRKPTTTSNHLSVRPEPRPASPASQPKTPNQNDESKFKSIFKKAGQILKKPF